MAYSLVEYIFYVRKKNEAYVFLKENPGMEFLLTFRPRKIYTVCQGKTALSVPAQTPLF
jgi:hypothetical protein